MIKMDCIEFVEKVRNNEIDVVEHTQKIIAEVKKVNKEYNFLNTISEDLAKDLAKDVNKNGALAGVPISVKDCICVKDVESTAGSRILSGYKPVFDATVIDRVKKAGGIIIGKTAQDVFGFGSFSVNVGLGFKVPKNPCDKDRSCGGSSGGSGGITKKMSFPHISLGESTGGSIEAPASFCGVIGFCPTYGRVSRYGLMDYGNSFDKIGPMAKSIKEVALMLDVIAGFDEKDSTSLNQPVDDYLDFVGKDLKGMKVGVIKETVNSDGVDPEIIDKCSKAVKELESNGAKVKEVSLPLTLKYGVSAYYLLAMSEASTNLAKYCGMRYGKHEKLEGNFNEYFTKVRSMHFNDEAKRRIMIGTFARMAGYRDAYYIKAAKVRTLIINEYKQHFKDCDVLVSPTMPMIAPRFDEIEKLTPLQHYMADIMTVGPNVAGIPHMSIPVGEKKKMPIGMMVMADHLEERKLIQVGSAFDG